MSYFNLLQRPSHRRAHAFSPQEAIWYWRKNDAIANFGDYLNQWLLDRTALFETLPKSPEILLCIGSILTNALLRDTGVERRRAVVWGSGVRRRKPIKARLRKKLDLYAVRGRITAEVLSRNDIAVGDPGLLMPRFYTPRPVVPELSSTDLIIPHFYQRQVRQELFVQEAGLTQADVIYPAILPTPGSVEYIIDRIAASRCVITNSLHAAIIAIAYQRPCVVQQFGYLDCPLKWEDFFSVFDMSPTFDARGRFPVPTIAPSLIASVQDRLLRSHPANH